MESGSNDNSSILQIPVELEPLTTEQECSNDSNLADPNTTKEEKESTNNEILVSDFFSLNNLDKLKKNAVDSSEKNVIVNPTIEDKSIELNEKNNSAVMETTEVDYESDSSTDTEVVEIPLEEESKKVIEISKNGSSQDSQRTRSKPLVCYRNYSSGSEDTSSDSSESSSSSSSECETESEGDDDEKNSTPSKSTKKKSKKSSELSLDELPAIEDLRISVPGEQTSVIGKILHIVDTLVVVQSIKDLPPLDIDSVLFLDEGSRPLGRIFDVMGPVSEPLYCVRFNSPDHIKEHNVEIDMLVYCAPQTEHSHFVFVKQLLKMKGSDASDRRDREVSPSRADFSDDEEERRLRRAGKKGLSAAPENQDQPQSKQAKFDSQPNRPNIRAQSFQPRNSWTDLGSIRQPRMNQQNTNASASCDSYGKSHNNGRNTYCGGYSSASQYYPRQSNASFGGPAPRQFNNRLPRYQPPRSLPSWNDNNYRPSSQDAQENQRYLAFSNEIARLVQAYNGGAPAPSRPYICPPTLLFNMPPPPPPPPPEVTAPQSSSSSSSCSPSKFYKNS